MGILNQTLNLRQKLAQFLTQDVKPTPVETKIQEIQKPAVSRREALDILKITIEEYQDLVKRRLNKTVEEKKIVAPAKLEGPLEDFMYEIRKAYKNKKLVNNNEFKFKPSDKHLEVVKTKVSEDPEADLAVNLFYSWYVKKYGVKKRQEAVVK